jgi:hypothetical protein
VRFRAGGGGGGGAVCEAGDSRRFFEAGALPSSESSSNEFEVATSG